MDKCALEILAERVERLERANRRLRRLGAGSLIGAVVAVAGAAKFADLPGVVRATEFRLVKDDGGEVPDERATLGTTPHHGTILQLHHKGSPEAPQIVLNAVPDNKSSIGIKGADGKLRIYLGLESDGKPKLILQDENGKVLFRAPAK